ncbi:NUDIX domain-containing protein [Clostridium folliculivorans]|uniref:NUDIX hydrolase n=1 Tax=Clostridium folliculivorans TaxID=2886038 RepID=A0A9W6DA77_9CLOT|nr:NUDIX domain-containing protein [Clostridium folliculivorans]GKU24914.1 NUDIX hydrolase [Clostridium folliculivorans]GKU31012.1 NUDIX hydrolase [Clostridium folliculivorans]
MLFEYNIGLNDLDRESIKIINRQAIRAVIPCGNKILLVNTNKGDYKFPGGGANKNETHEDTLKREVMEETGYIVRTVKEKIGQIVQRSLDKYEEDTIFQMVSHYYLCEIEDDKVNQKLDDYEKELGFSPKLIELDKAISANELILENGEDINPWVYRETKALKAIQRYYGLT